MNIKQLEDIPSWEWPDNADKIIRETLHNKDADASDRLLSAHLAGDITVINDEMADSLLSVVNTSDESIELRSQAAIALGPVLEYTFEALDDLDDLTISPGMFNRIQESFRKLHQDPLAPKEVRRRILESSVRSPQEWHREAIENAYRIDDEEWQLTAVFCMGYVKGFNKEILAALSSKNSDIYYEAICAAGNWGLDGAWQHVADIITGKEADKSLLLEAIDAAVNIRPNEAAVILSDLMYSEDEDIAEAVQEAIAMCDAFTDADLDNDEDFDDEDDKIFH
jgi:hypothetical protein